MMSVELFTIVARLDDGRSNGLTNSTSLARSRSLRTALLPFSAFSSSEHSLATVDPLRLNLSDSYELLSFRWKHRVHDDEDMLFLCWDIENRAFGCGERQLDAVHPTEASQ